MSEKWGQNFLVSQKYARQIASQAVGMQRLLEIGPGRGILTKELLEQGASVMAVEIDPTLCARLHQEIGCDRLMLYNEDILKFDFEQLGAEKIFVIGNIPYQITSPLIEKLMRAWSRWSGIVLLVQKEVADRMCADARTRDYSALSVMVATFAHMKKLFDVHRSHFQPRPQIDSTLVAFTMRPQPLIDNVSSYPWFLKTLFSQRRKKLINSLSQFFAGERPGTAYEWIGLDQRIETIDVSSITRLYDQIRHDGRFKQPGA